jgi:hypothetical protein
MLFLQPLAFTKDFQTGAVHDEMDRPSLSTRDLIGKFSPVPRREKVE